MKHLDHLFANNRAWAGESVVRDPEYFSRLCHQQRPDLLWIGCSDSRVPANEIVGLAPGELFVHRNVANVVPVTDLNAMAVIEYAVSSLCVRHIVVCGHYRCGGVRAALEGHQAGAVALWLQPLRNLADEHREELLTLGPGHHFGEWWGAGIQRRYGLTEKRFSLFNVSRWNEQTPPPLCCNWVPTLYVGEFNTEHIAAVLAELVKTGSAAAPGFMNPEGIVIYHTAAKHCFKKTIEGDSGGKGAANAEG